MPKNREAARANLENLYRIFTVPEAPDSTLGAIDQAITDDVAGGWFRFALDDRAWQARVMERLVGWRVRLLRLPYGDQTVTKRRGDPWDTGKDHVIRAMSLKPEEATPERIALENEAARRHGTGAYYDDKGICRVPTRGSRAKEMRRGHEATDFKLQDNDAGYGDYPGR